MDVVSVTKLVDIGLYSYVFEVRGQRENEETTRAYILKRTFFHCPSAIRGVLRELHVFSRLLMEKVHSRLLPKLYHSSTLHGSNIMIMNTYSGLNLSDVRHEGPVISERAAKFYIVEVMCALEKLHQLKIVHMDVKPSNVLLCESGHIMLSNFDRAFDLSGDGMELTDKCFGGTLRYVAPEIFNREEITTKADIWNLGMMMCALVSNPPRPTCSKRELLKMAKIGDYTIESYGELSSQLQSFFKICLNQNYADRPDISMLKTCAFFSRIVWEQAEACGLHPPFLPCEFEKHGSLFHIDTEQIVLDMAYGANIPKRKGAIEFDTDELGRKILKVDSVNQDWLDSEGYTVDKLADLLSTQWLKDLSTSVSTPSSSNESEKKVS